jgi:hypothetical protein
MFDYLSDDGDNFCPDCRQEWDLCECGQGTLDDAATDFAPPKERTPGVVFDPDDHDGEEYDDPAWCNRCNHDIAFCICTCEDCGKDMAEEMRPGEKLCSGCANK